MCLAKKLGHSSAEVRHLSLKLAGKLLFFTKDMKIASCQQALSNIEMHLYRFLLCSLSVDLSSKLNLFRMRNGLLL